MTDTLAKWATWREIRQKPQVLCDWAQSLGVDGLRAKIAGVQYAADVGLNIDDPFTGQDTPSPVVSGVQHYAVAS